LRLVLARFWLSPAFLSSQAELWSARTKVVDLALQLENCLVRHFHKACQRWSTTDSLIETAPHLCEDISTGWARHLHPPYRSRAASCRIQNHSLPFCPRDVASSVPVVSSKRLQSREIGLMTTSCDAYSIFARDDGRASQFGKPAVYADSADRTKCPVRTQLTTAATVHDFGTRAVRQHVAFDRQKP
jgi:hypothetical protein